MFTYVGWLGRNALSVNAIHLVVTKIPTLNVVARKTVTIITNTNRAITCIKCRIELSNLIIYIGVIVLDAM